MQRRHLYLLLILVAPALPGCMQTRHIEVTSVTNCGFGECAGISHDSTYSERTWCGFWAGQPARVQP